MNIFLKNLVDYTVDTSETKIGTLEVRRMLSKLFTLF